MLTCFALPLPFSLSFSFCTSRWLNSSTFLLSLELFLAACRWLCWAFPSFQIEQCHQRAIFSHDLCDVKPATLLYFASKAWFYDRRDSHQICELQSLQWCTQADCARTECFSPHLLWDAPCQCFNNIPSNQRTCIVLSCHTSQYDNGCCSSSEMLHEQWFHIHRFACVSFVPYFFPYFSRFSLHFTSSHCARREYDRFLTNDVCVNQHFHEFYISRA